MANEPLRVVRVTVEPAYVLEIVRQGRDRDAAQVATMSLEERIASGGEILRPLADPDLFACAELATQAPP